MKLTTLNTSGLGRVTDFDDWFRHPFAGMPALSRLFDWEGALSGAGGRLATDIHEDKDNYYATFEVPGVKRENVKIELNNKLLSVTVERMGGSDDKESGYVANRSISVPDSVNPESITAKVEDGILTVTLPKSEHRKPRTIDVA